MKFINSIKEIADNYEYFILDIWGVIHDGNQAYPDSAKVVEYLKSLNKKICFLSNAPRRSSKVEEALEKFGIKKEFYEFILTSGEATYLTLEENQKNNFKDFGKNYFYIGPQKDADILDGLDYVAVKNPSKASFVLNTGFNDLNSTMEEKLPQAIEAKKYDLPMICVNPDLVVIRQTGQEMLCAGALAKKYEEMGGKVIYFGKPHPLVYKITCEIFKNSNNKDIIAIGDGLETDIKGAINSNIDNVLVTGGILSNVLKTSYGQNANKEKLEEICKKYQVNPKFVISNFKL